MESLPRNGVILDLINGLAPDPDKVAMWISEVRKSNPGLHNDELADIVGDKIVWAYTRQGAALALPGAIPGLGTIVQATTEIGAVAADSALMIRNQSYLVFALACIYGYQNREILIQDTLICVGLWTNALILAKSGAIHFSSKIAMTTVRDRLPGKVLQAINRRVGSTILTKYGTKRGGVALGKLIPLGVGVLVGAGFNYLTMKKFKTVTMNYFSAKACFVGHAPGPFRRRDHRPHPLPCA